MHRRVVLAGIGLGVVPLIGFAAAQPAPDRFVFASIDGGLIDLADFRGKPVLVVNTASLCGFSGQFNDLQALQDRHGARGLVVLAVPSDDFRQELNTAQAIKDHCALRYDLTLPMTDITHVRGAQAHPFYKWLAAEHNFIPGWNFNKVLIGPTGALLGTWGASVKPTAGAITRQIEPLLR